MSKNKSIQPKNIKPVSAPAQKDGQPGAPAGVQLPSNMPKLPPEVEKKLEALKTKLDGFKAKVLEKFGDYIVGIALLPPEKPLPKEGESQEVPKEEKSKEDKAKEDQKINLLVVVDDTTSQKMTKDELHQKFSTIIQKIAEETDKTYLHKAFY